jgi:hypothetical protein
MIASLRAALDAQMALAERDRAKYLALAGGAPANNEFVLRLLTGNYKEAASAPTGPPAGLHEWESEATRAGLLYLAARKAHDAAFADQQWKNLADALSHGDRDARRLAQLLTSDKPLDLPWLRGALIPADTKRVLLAAVARRYPSQGKELDALARKLDFPRDPTSLCLRYVTE